MVSVKDGLTLHGTWTINDGTNSVISFDGPQTITAGAGSGTFHLLKNTFGGSFGSSVLQAIKGGPWSWILRSPFM